jgi:2-iminobutanoate/2-iminopropanoate deaminase
MDKRNLNAADAPQPSGGYSQVCEISNPTRWAFVSGQIPQSVDGVVPTDFESQARLAWRNVEAQLRAANMTLDNIVKVTTYLSDRQYSVENRNVRNEVLGERSPALTVIIAGIFDSAWLLEIEAVAAA